MREGNEEVLSVRNWLKDLLQILLIFGVFLLILYLSITELNKKLDAANNVIKSFVIEQSVLVEIIEMKDAEIKELNRMKNVGRD